MKIGTTIFCAAGIVTANKQKTKILVSKKNKNRQQRLKKFPCHDVDQRTREHKTNIMKKIVTNDSAAKTPNNNEFRDEIYELTTAHPRNEEEILELRAYPRAFVKFMGSHEGAVFLSQMIYWTERMKKRGDGFFYKSVSDWVKELDITEYQVEQARDFLKSKGVLEMVKRRVLNFKPQWHYRLNKQRFWEVYKDFLDNEYVFPHEEINFDDEEYAEVFSENTETEYEDEVEMLETDTEFQDSVTCFEESVPRKEETVSSIEEVFAQLQENNNNVLNNKSNIDSYNELIKELINSRSTPPPAKNSRTDTYIASDDEVTDRNTGGNNISKARLALDAFRSVGANYFDVTVLDDVNKRPHDYRENADLVTNLEQGIDWCEKRGFSFIVRPRGGALIQVDDCDTDTYAELLPFCFFAEETSQGNYQVWLALPAGTSPQEVEKVRKRLLKKLELSSGNGGAYGATRWVGSINFKPNRNRFRVRLIYAGDGDFTSVEELENAGLLAEPEKPVEKQSMTKGFKRAFPDYDRCLRDKKYDRSDADAAFLAICKDRGFSKAESIERLKEVSERAKESPASYLQRTVDFVFGEED